ncbi:MAG: VanZ family protein [Gammaproteobacteria bacterium]
MPAWLEPRPLQRRSLWLAGGWLLVCVVIALSLWPRLPRVDIGFEHLDKIGHGAAYAALMAWFGFIYQRHSHAIIFGLLVSLGIALEGAQYALGYRMFELLDVGANTVGIAVGLLFVRALFFRR